MKRTKILCTIGPSSEEPEILKKMIDAGMDGIRLNTAHGTFDQYDKIIENIRLVSEDIPILVDVKGPEIRARTVSTMHLKKDQLLKIGFDKSHDVWITKDFYDNVNIGDTILFCNGMIRTNVIAKHDNTRTLDLKVNSDGILENNKGVNVPGVYIPLPALSKKDLDVLSWCTKKNIDFVALSFARNRKDIDKVRGYIGKNIKLIAKIENQEGVNNLDEIIDAADGIMIARGDLGAELGIENIPIIQKKIIQKCIEVGDICITATQMLESMITNPLPTRAEVSDVATAVFDGSDCLMLSGETAIGRYPVEAVRIMSQICKRIEMEIPPKIIQFDNVKKQNKTISEAITHAIPPLAREVGATKIIAFTRSGFTAIMISRFRYPAQIIAITSTPKFFRQLRLYFGIHPVCLPDSQQTIVKASEYLLKNHIINKDDILIYSSGTYKYRSHHSNMIEVHKISDLCSGTSCHL